MTYKISKATILINNRIHRNWKMDVMVSDKELFMVDIRRYVRKSHLDVIEIDFMCEEMPDGEWNEEIE